MWIEPLASSSAGNSYIISDGVSRIMIDCGIDFTELKIKTNFFNPRIDGCLISHSHGDHSKSVGKLLKFGIRCYMSAETCSEIEKGAHVGNTFVSHIKHNENFNIGTFSIKPLLLNHDVHCLGFYIYSSETKESLFFATDTYMITYRFKQLDYIMVEANYDLSIVNYQIATGEYESVAKERLMKSHMEINSTLLWLKKQNLSGCKRIYLLHLSNGSSDKDKFKQLIIEETGIPVTVCEA